MNFGATTRRLMDYRLSLIDLAARNSGMLTDRLGFYARYVRVLEWEAYDRLREQSAGGDYRYRYADWYALNDLANYLAELRRAIASRELTPESLAQRLKYEAWQAGPLYDFVQPACNHCFRCGQRAPTRVNFDGDELCAACW